MTGIYLGWVKVINALSEVIQYRLYVALWIAVAPLHHPNCDCWKRCCSAGSRSRTPNITVADSRGVVANLCPVAPIAVAGNHGERHSCEEAADRRFWCVEVSM